MFGVLEPVARRDILHLILCEPLKPFDFLNRPDEVRYCPNSNKHQCLLGFDSERTALQRNSLVLQRVL